MAYLNLAAVPQQSINIAILDKNQMFESVSRSWELTKQTLEVIKKVYSEDIVKHAFTSRKRR